MNKRQKFKKIKKKNKQLIEKYPFLLPRNVWTDKLDPTYNYSFTELDCMPIGWKKAFGELLCEDIKNELIKSGKLDDYRVQQIKEKYGTLRWYDNFNVGNMQKILMKYEHISEFVCVICGKVNVPIYNDGWVCPYCDSCYKQSWNNRKYKPNKSYESYKIYEPMLTAQFKVTQFSKEGKKTETLDCSDILIRMGVDIKKLPTLEEAKEYANSHQEEI